MTALRDEGRHAPVLGMFLLAGVPVFVLIVALACSFTPVKAAAAQANSSAAMASGTLPTLAQVKAATKTASRGAMVPVSVFRGPDGLVGAVVQSAKDARQKTIVWFTPHLDAVMVNGHLVSRQDVDLSLQARYSQGLQLPPSEALFRASTTDSQPIMVGHAGPIVTAFFDPNCIYCHALYTQLAPMIQDGKIRLRLVLVGVIKASSRGRAASILMSGDPAAALATNEAHFDVKHENGGTPIAQPRAGTPAAAVLARAERVVDANTRLFDKAGATGTPAMMFCSKATQQVQLMPGLPGDLQGWLHDVQPLSACRS